MTPKEFLEAPDQWPNWPILPVVKRNADWDDPDCMGFVHAGNLKRVFFSLIFTIPKDITTLKSREFETTDALLEAYRID